MSGMRISDHEHQDLLKAAVQVEPFRGERDPRVGGETYKHTVKRKVHVPVEKEVKVPVVKRSVESRVDRHVVEGTKMVPVKKFRDVKETVIETKEEVVEGFRERWVKIKEPTREVVKKQIPVTRTKRVPYVDYVEERVEKVVEVPKDIVKEKRGFRVDKHIGTKVVEVEEDHHYEMRPVYVKKGDMRVRETGDYQHHGKAVHGRSQFEAGGEERYVSVSRHGGGGESYGYGGGEAKAHARAGGYVGGDSKAYARTGGNANASGYVGASGYAAANGYAGTRTNRAAANANGEFYSYGGGMESGSPYKSGGDGYAASMLSARSASEVGWGELSTSRSAPAGKFFDDAASVRTSRAGMMMASDRRRYY